MTEVDEAGEEDEEEDDDVGFVDIIVHAEKTHF